MEFFPKTRSRPRILLAAACGAVLGAGCSTFQEYTQREKLDAVLEIDSIPQGAEVYISRDPSAAVTPGKPGGEWIARGTFTFRGRTPLQLQDEVVKSTRGVKKVSGGVTIYETTGATVYEENSRRIVLLQPGYKTIDVAERIGRDTRFRFDLERVEKGTDAASGAPEVKGPLVAPGAQGKLSLVSSPSPADVEVDGRYVGETPASLQLPPGSHKLVLRRQGFIEWRREIDTLPGSDQKVTATLERAPETPPAGQKTSP